MILSKADIYAEVGEIFSGAKPQSVRHDRVQVCRDRRRGHRRCDAGLWRAAAVARLDDDRLRVRPEDPLPRSSPVPMR